MTEKTKIIDGTAKIICPVCLKPKSLDLSSEGNKDASFKVEVKCPCGNSFNVLLDKRKYDRAELIIPGIYLNYIEGNEADREPMTVLDLSPFGVKFMLHDQRSVEPGDKLTVMFNLDDTQKTLIKKKVVVRHQNNRDIGAVFYSEKERKKIKSYLESLQKMEDKS